jgi:hypothetical protein
MKDLTFTELVRQATNTKDKATLLLLVNEINRRQQDISKTETYKFIKKIKIKKGKNRTIL